MIKKIICFGVLLIMVFSFTGCNKPGFEFGFNYQRGVGGLIAVAARSDKTEFDINDVTIEFSYGWYDGYHDINQLKYVLYFLELSNSNYVTSQMNPYDLSNNIDKAIFIKEISAEEFLSAEYEFKLSRIKGKEFNHSEMLTVPKEVIPSDYPNGRGEIMLMIAKIAEYDEEYKATQIQSIVIPYQYINEKTIKIRV